MANTRISHLTEAGLPLDGLELIEVSQPSTTVTITATTISAQASDNSYNDSANGFVAAGFAVDMSVVVVGFTGDVANNIKVGKVTALAAGKMTIGGTDGDVIVDEAAGDSVTISAWVSRRTTVNEVAAASVAFASVGELNAGTEAAKTVSPDVLAGSNFGTAVISLLLSDPNGSAITTGDGKAYWPVPSTLNGMDLISARASLSTAGTGGGFLLQLRRKRAGADVDMLSTRISIDSGDDDSNDATTPPAINAANDDVATNDRIFFDLDGVPTGGKGLVVTLQFRLP